MGDGLLDLHAAAAFTGRSHRSLTRLYQRGKLTPVGRDAAGRLLFPVVVMDQLRRTGRPSELLAA